MTDAADAKTSTDLVIVDCGVADYRFVLDRQIALHGQRLAGLIADTVLLCEHPAVITMGARRSANRLLADRNQLAGQGIDVVEVLRGGGTTAHNPGQLVFYPIVDLRRLGFAVGDYVRTLEAIGMALLGGLGVRAVRRKGLPGLWVEDRKIASIGVRVQKGVTFHGMAINIRNDLHIFDLFVPCGLDGVRMTHAVMEAGHCPPMAEVKARLTEQLIKHLSRTYA